MADGVRAWPHVLLDAHTIAGGMAGRLGPARALAFRPHPPWWPERQPADADGEVRHKKPENVRKYFRPSAEAIAEVTSLLAPHGGRR